jgi:hypothetical protein
MNAIICLAFLMETKSVYCEVGTEIVDIIKVNCMR